MRTGKPSLAPAGAGADTLVRVGRLVAIDSDGSARIELADGRNEPLRARSLVQISEAQAADLGSLPLVAVSFEDGDAELPIIVGWVHERIVGKSATPAVNGATPTPEAILDGKRVVLRAEQEIMLACGASSILLRGDGHVVIKGAHVVSRSSGPNKIKGATISLN